MFYHIYIDSKDFKDTYFRFWSWFREGLIHKQRLSVRNYEVHATKLQSEKKEIDRILDELQQHPAHQLLTLKQKKKYEKYGEWCFSSNRELLESAGFSEPLSKNSYNYFSSFTHPTSSGHLQTSQADFETASRSLDNMMNILFICSGLYIHNYALMFREVDEFLNEKDKEFVASWCELGRKLMK